MRPLRTFVSLVWLIMLAACSGPGVPTAQQYASISGIVLDAATNQPIAGATITVDVVNTTTTATNGTFTIGNLPNGAVECSASAPNYQSRNDWCGTPLSPGQNLTGVTIKLTHT